MNAIVHITRPELTPQERARRMESIKKAATDLVIATDLAKKRKEAPT